jgi:hypothetical protein
MKHRAWCLTLAGAALLGCGNGSGRVPADLLGTWTAHGGAYADRAITFDSAVVVLQVGPGQQVTYGIVRVLSTTGAGARVDRIAVRLPDGDADTLWVLRDANDPDRLRLRNVRDVVWLREPRQAPPRPTN